MERDRYETGGFYYSKILNRGDTFEQIFKTFRANARTSSFASI